MVERTSSSSFMRPASSHSDFGITNGKIRENKSGRNKRVGRRRRKASSGDTLGVILDEKSFVRLPSKNIPRRGVRIFYEQPSDRSEVPESETSNRVRVKAVKAAATIDVVAVLGKVFGGATSAASALGELGIGAPTRHVFGKNGTSILFQLPSPPPSPGQPFDPSPRFVAVFKFGSVVFHNLTTQESGRILSEIKKHSSDPVSYGFEKTERFEVAIQPDLPEASGEVTSEFATVKELEIHSVAVISKIMVSNNLVRFLIAFVSLSTSAITNLTYEVD